MLKESPIRRDLRNASPCNPTPSVDQGEPTIDSHPGNLPCSSHSPGWPRSRAKILTFRCLLNCNDCNLEFSFSFSIFVIIWTMNKIQIFSNDYAFLKVECLSTNLSFSSPPLRLIDYSHGGAGPHYRSL